jgi:anti-sigma factor RsiW
MSEEDDDALLTGLVDGELDAARKAALLTRLGAEAALRARLAAIEAGSRPFAPAFAILLDAAPIERMKASLAALPLPGEGAAPRRFSTAVRALAASLAVALFLGGFGLARLAPQFGVQSRVASSQSDGWRDAVAEYAALYTRGTFSTAPADAVAQAAGLASLGAKLGVDLTPERTRIDNLTLKAAFELAYDGAPLGQLAYSPAGGAPVLFCIFANSQPDAPLTNETRDNFALTSWARNGRAYMVIGQLPADQIAQIAGELSRRF